jgi:two-component system, NarL family, invasion response regulator UvrY
MTETGTQVLLVDDHAVVRAGCRQLLQGWAGFEVMEARDGEEALRLADQIAPRLVVLDLNLPTMSGFEVIKALRDRHPQTRILVFSMHEDPAYAVRAMEYGAHGYVSKNDDPDAIVEAARKVAAGETYLSQPIAQKLALLTLKGHKNPASVLSRREKDVLDLFGQGKSLSEIAAQLGISYKTTANTCTQIKAKLNLTTTLEMMRFAVAQNLDRG